MITSEGNFILATPTKCGTTTLEAVAKRHMRNSGVEADLFRIMDWDSPRRQHRMCLPPTGQSEINHGGQGEPTGLNEWGDVDRYLFVRNPYTRYMSIYTYLSAPANYSQWGAREIQGKEWGGHDRKKIVSRPKMSFEQFLFWLAGKRSTGERMKRGFLTSGHAYRSPWVWTDSLTMSLGMLRDQPGEGRVRGLLHLESIWRDLFDLLTHYGLQDSVDVGGIHANRTTGYGAEGADPGSKEFWGGIRCSRHAFTNRVFNPQWVDMSHHHDRVDGEGCGCGACVIGVWYEAEELGYGLLEPDLG